MNFKKISAPILMILLLNGFTAFAGKLEAILVAPPDLPQAGEQVVFSVYLHNWTDEAVHVNLPESVNCRLKFADQVIEIAARATESKKTGSAIIREKGFIQEHF